MLDILFIQNYYEQMLGIMHISSMLKKNGYTTDVIIGTKKDIINKAIKEKPRVIGFYCTTGFHHKNISVSAELKRILKDETLIIFGGPHPTFVPSIIRCDGVDIVCRGEGEYAVLDLIRALHDKKDYTKIKNLILKRDGKIFRNEIRPLCDIDQIPYPDREIYRGINFIYKNKRQEVMIGRGCAFDCTYCSNHAYKKLYLGKGDYVRFRSIPNVIEELEIVKNLYKPSNIFFHDDNFILKKDYCIKFLEIYKKKINIPFACLIRADLITEDLIRILKEKGCYYVYFGIESGNEKLRKKVLKKNISNGQILHCADLLRKYRLPFSTFNMIGLPSETLSDVWVTADINKKAKPTYALFFLYQTLPGTQLAEFALDKGFIRKIDVDVSDSTFHESSIMLRRDQEGRKILRLKNTVNLMVKFPFISSITKYIMINLPFDKIYSLLDKFLYFIFYYTRLTYKLSFLRKIYTGFFLLFRLKEFK